MKQPFYLLFTVICSLFISCAAVKGIFKAGFWVGAVIVVVIVLALFMVFGKKKS